MMKSVLGSMRRCAFFLALLIASAPVSSRAQILTHQQGSALRVDLLDRAQNLSMRDFYARSLYSHIRANPATFQNPNFYLNFLVYLMQTDKDFSCNSAFSSEFERQDFFSQSFALQGQLAQIISAATIPERFDVAYTLETGEYIFSTGKLPLERVRSINQPYELSGTIQPRGRRNYENCARNMLQGTNVKTDQFPWSFSIVNETGSNQRRVGFPFPGPLQLPSTDARELFQRFGRQLYAVISYQVRAAADGSRKIQVIATDGQMFGLSSDAVVRVQTFAHPTLSQPNYLDITNAMELELADIRTTMNLAFQQQGFRAVGNGTRLGNGTDFSAAVRNSVTGSGAVGFSSFVVRVSSPQFLSQVSNINGINTLHGAERYLTLFGSVDFESVTTTSAPISGTYVVHQINPQTGQLEQSEPYHFRGRFLAPGASQSAETKQEEPPVSQLDELSRAPETAAPSEPDGTAPSQ